MPKRYRRNASGLGLGLCLLALLWAPPASGDKRDDELERKATLFRDALVERHLSREGIVLYRVNLQTIQSDLQDGRYPNLADAPTFTGQLAAAMCARAKKAETPEADLALAEIALSGLEALMHVTGRPGLFARSLRRDAGRDVTGLSGDWHPADAPYENFVFRSDASADQYANGILPAIAECAERFPRRSRDLIVAIAGHLDQNQLRLMDVDGERTRYGDLSPRSGFGFNSIFKVTGYAVFVLASRLDSDPRWVERRDQLRDEARVPAESKLTNLRVLGITNHSNDLMAWNLYRVLIPLARSERDPALDDLLDGMQRARKRVAPYKNAYLDAVYCLLEEEQCTPELRAQIQDELARFPLDKTLRGSPPELEDWPRRWIPGRKWRRLARDLVPIELRAPSSFEWKSSPYRLTRAPVPNHEYTGTDYLAAWALARPLTGYRAAKPRCPQGNP